MQSVIHSTCCSIETGMFDSTDGLCGPVMVKKFGKPATAIAKVGVRAVHPFAVERAAAAALQVEGLQRAGQRVETGREHDDVARVFLAAGADALCGDLFDCAIGRGIDQQHVVVVEGLVVVGVERLALSP